MAKDSDKGDRIDGAVAAKHGGTEEGERTVYRPTPDLHICEAGKVVKSNWVGRVGNREVRVMRGAQVSGMPDGLVQALTRDHIEMGKVTLDELGLAPVRGRGAQIISVE